MASYFEIQSWTRQSYNFTPKTCWIAHVKSDNGLTTRAAPNRYSIGARLHPCPPNRREGVEAALRHFQMIE